MQKEFTKNYLELNKSLHAERLTNPFHTSFLFPFISEHLVSDDFFISNLLNNVFFIESKYNSSFLAQCSYIKDNNENILIRLGLYIKNSDEGYLKSIESDVREELINIKDEFKIFKDIPYQILEAVSLVQIKDVLINYQLSSEIKFGFNFSNKPALSELIIKAYFKHHHDILLSSDDAVFFDKFKFEIFDIDYDKSHMALKNPLFNFNDNIIIEDIKEYIILNFKV